MCTGFRWVSKKVSDGEKKRGGGLSTTRIGQIAYFLKSRGENEFLKINEETLEQ